MHQCHFPRERWSQTELTHCLACAFAQWSAGKRRVTRGLHHDNSSGWSPPMTTLLCNIIPLHRWQISSDSTNNCLCLWGRMLCQSKQNCSTQFFPLGGNISDASWFIWIHLYHFFFFLQNSFIAIQFQSLSMLIGDKYVWREDRAWD